MNHRIVPALRLLLVTMIALGTSACGAGVDAGTNGGVAFVLLTIFLLIGAVALYLALGRED